MANSVPRAPQRNLSVRPLQRPLVSGRPNDEPIGSNPDGVSTATGTAAPATEGAHSCAGCDWNHERQGRPPRWEVRSTGFYIWSSTWYRSRKRPKPGTEAWLLQRKKEREEKERCKWLECNEILPPSEDSETDSD
ncbi:VP3 [Gyrovirus 11]|uniref:VP3 n=1 Tax=Gyrovirus 11 TaxID=2547963 RepID=A0A482D407_9VIRU|nr:VP3 [Gyrovirus 11]QBM01055.1 VP3 [Gyrovirus 11]